MQSRGAGKHRAVTNNVVMMGSNEAETENNSENLKLGTYDRKTHKNNEFFTKYPCDMIFDGIQQKLFADMDVSKDSVKLDPKKWKMSVNFKEKRIQSQKEFLEEENKEEEEMDIYLETEMQI